MTDDQNSLAAFAAAVSLAVVRSVVARTGTRTVVVSAPVARIASVSVSVTGSRPVLTVVVAVVALTSISLAGTIAPGIGAATFRRTAAMTAIVAIAIAVTIMPSATGPVSSTVIVLAAAMMTTVMTTAVAAAMIVPVMPTAMIVTRTVVSTVIPMMVAAVSMMPAASFAAIGITARVGVVGRRAARACGEAAAVGSIVGAAGAVTVDQTTAVDVVAARVEGRRGRRRCRDCDFGRKVRRIGEGGAAENQGRGARGEEQKQAMHFDSPNGG